MKLLIFAAEPLIFARPLNPSRAERGEEIPFELFLKYTASWEMQSLARPLRRIASRFLPEIQTAIVGDFVQKPGIQMIVNIAKVLGVSIEDLLK